MYEVIYMKAEYEPWWMFDGWEKYIQESTHFKTFEEATECLQNWITIFRKKYEHEIIKNEYHAFWSAEEQVFCEACDEDLQVFHGLFITANRLETDNR